MTWHLVVVLCVGMICAACTIEAVLNAIVSIKRGGR